MVARGAWCRGWAARRSSTAVVEALAQTWLEQENQLVGTIRWTAHANWPGEPATPEPCRSRDTAPPSLLLRCQILRGGAGVVARVPIRLLVPSAVISAFWWRGGQLLGRRFGDAGRIGGDEGRRRCTSRSTSGCTSRRTGGDEKRVSRLHLM
jgi:hypothetical protein